LVEGLPGSGKSTTAKYVARRLDEAHVPGRLLQEVEPDHPLNVGGALHPAGATTGEVLFERYTIDAYVAESLERWHAFVTSVSGLDTTSVLDSYPYQNAARVLLQMDAPLSLIQAYIARVEAIARPLAPVLVYLRTQPTPEAVGAVARGRGEAWTAYAIQVITNCPYAHHRQLTGAPGAVALLAAYAAVLDKLLQQSTIPHLKLEGCGHNWDDCYAQLDAFLSL
jgi:hypothetical protein